MFAPYPNAFRAPFHRGPGPYDDALYLDYIEDWLLVHQVEPEQIAGVLIEPILGEGGILAPSEAFWGRLTGAVPAVRLDADPGRGADLHGPLRHDVRRERWDLEPDILLLGKGIAGGGQPIARVLGTEQVDGRLRRALGRHLRLDAGRVRRRAGRLDAILAGDVLENVARDGGDRAGGARPAGRAVRAGR